MKITPEMIDAGIQLFDQGVSIGKVVSVLTATKLDDAAVEQVGKVVVWVKSNRELIDTLVGLVNGWLQAEFEEAALIPDDIMDGIVVWHAANREAA